MHNVHLPETGKGRAVSGSDQDRQVTFEETSMTLTQTQTKIQHMRFTPFWIPYGSPKPQVYKDSRSCCNVNLVSSAIGFHGIIWANKVM